MVKVASELQLGWSLEDREDTLAISRIRRHGETYMLCGTQVLGNEICVAHWVVQSYHNV